MATTEFVGERVVINDGVQGGTVSYANVARLMRECGVEERAQWRRSVSFRGAHEVGEITARRRRWWRNCERISRDLLRRCELSSGLRRCMRL